MISTVDRRRASLTSPVRLTASVAEVTPVSVIVISEVSTTLPMSILKQLTEPLAPPCGNVNRRRNRRRGGQRPVRVRVREMHIKWGTNPPCYDSVHRTPPYCSLAPGKRSSGIFTVASSSSSSIVTVAGPLTTVTKPREPIGALQHHPEVLGRSRPLRHQVYTSLGTVCVRAVVSLGENTTVDLILMSYSHEKSCRPVAVPLYLWR